MQQLELSEIQAKAILDMRLQRLTQLERREGGPGAHGGAPAHRAAAGHPRLRRPRAADHQGGAARPQGGVRRRASDGDRRGDGRAHARGPDRRRGDGGHRHALGLHQADGDRGLPEPAPGRQGRHRHGDQGRGRRREPLHRLDARLPPVLHERRQGPLAEGARDPRGQARRPGQGPREPAAPRGAGARGGHPLGAGLHDRRLRVLRDAPGPGEEDRAGRVLAAPAGRDPRHHARRGRRGHGGAA